MDLRRQKTQLALEQALLKLLRRKSLKEIKSKELTDLAQVSRQTFYAHYELIEELFNDCLVRIFDNLHRELQSIDSDPNGIYNQSLVIKAFKIYYDHADELRILFRVADKDLIIQSIYQHYAIYNIFTDDVVNDPLVLEFAKLNFAGGFYTVLKEWLVNRPSMSPEDFAQVYLTLLYGIKTVDSDSTTSNGK